MTNNSINTSYNLPSGVIMAQILLRQSTIFYWIYGPFHEIEPTPDTVNEAQELRLVRSHAPGKKSTTILLNAFRQKTFLMAYCYTHKSRHPSTPIGEVFAADGN